MPPFGSSAPHRHHPVPDRRPQRVQQRPDHRPLPRPGRPHHQQMRPQQPQPVGQPVLTQRHRQRRQVMFASPRSVGRATDGGIVSSRSAGPRPGTTARAAIDGDRAWSAPGSPVRRRSAPDAEPPSVQSSSTWPGQHPDEYTIHRPGPTHRQQPRQVLLGVHLAPPDPWSPSPAATRNRYPHPHRPPPAPQPATPPAG